MKVKFSFISLIFIFFSIFYIFYLGLKNSSIYTPNVEIKKNVPLFEAVIFDTNKKISSEKLFERNKYYLMNIWSSWCIPCKEEHKYLMNLKKKNLEIIGLNYKDNLNQAKKFLNELGNPYEIILSDENGIIAIEWGAYGVPETFLIYNNRIIKKIVGPLNDNELLEIIKLLK